MIDDFLNALQNFTRQKMRSFLSLLGVIIGVASVIAITSICESSTQEVKDTFGSAGLDVVIVQNGYMRRKRDAITIKFDEAFRENLFGAVKNIKKIWYKNSTGGSLSFGDTSCNISCDAIEDGYLEMYGIELEEGRRFTVTENVRGLQKIILSKTVADALFPAGGALGGKVLLSENKVSFCFEVVGVLKEQNSGMENTSNNAYVPRGFYAKKIEPNPCALTVAVQCVSAEKASALAEDIKSYCKSLTGTDYSVNAMSMQSMMEQMDKITGAMSLTLAAIAAISLFVGGIGIMNIMLVTVTERRQEIGIRKALGASPADIRRQFLVESAAITLVGGAIGILIGALVSVASECAKSRPLVVSAKACGVSFVFSVFVGIFFGLNPAVRAAKLDPVLALSGE